jgi:hypothetical protein
MSSNYNSRPRACEVIVDGDRVHLARPRERIADLFEHESVCRKQAQNVLSRAASADFSCVRIRNTRARKVRIAGQCCNSIECG